MKRRSLRVGVGTAAVLVVAALLSPALEAQTVSVTTDITGDVLPGATVTVTATVETADGSTVQSYAWSYLEGVEPVLADETTDTVSVTLGAQTLYKDELLHLLAEPPISEDLLPPNVELPETGYASGLQNRFSVTGVNPYALERAGEVVLQLDVVTTSNETWQGVVALHATLPWKTASGIHNVPVGIPVLLHGKQDQAAYDWALTAPAGSAATLVDGTSQNTWFTPDVAGAYQVTVTDTVTDEEALNEEQDADFQVEMTVYAGTWRGIIEGQDEAGYPVASTGCTSCHSGGAPDAFTPWARTGHADIFTFNLNTSDHYGPNCFGCHTVGYDPDVDNGGFDDTDGYQEFLESGLLESNNGDEWTTMLASHGATAQLANVQCENCHGPQSSEAHSLGAPRQNLSSDLCATCHGEPTRHARFQQWQLSAHANYDTAIAEGTSRSCAKCHSANGFLAWLPMLTDGDPANDGDNPNVTWTADEVHPQTCQTCHDPHNIGTDSGSDPVVTVRISGDTPALMAGFTATDVGSGALCMTCHNSRRGLRNDDVFASIYGTSDATRAPHGGTQTDVLMGQNLYGIEVGSRSFHSQVEDSCVACHMEATDPPGSPLSNNYSGTNHAFSARKEICASCHQFYTATDVQGPVAAQLTELQSLIEQALLDLISAQLAAGNTVEGTWEDVDEVEHELSVTAAEQITELEFGEGHGRQAIAFHLADGTVTALIGLNSLDVVPPTGDAFDLYSVADPRVVKAGWNWNVLNNDGSLGVHNPAIVTRSLTVTVDEVETVIEEGGGGSGTGTTCSSRYWTEIAAHNEGIGSLWRTDLVARNAGLAAAGVEITLHTTSLDYQLPAAAIEPTAQGVFEDVVGLIGVEGKGALEICSTQPLDLVSRIYNQTDNGTYGQFIGSFTTEQGLGEDESALLLGLRQEEDRFRTNISVTNAGTLPAEVSITLYATDGSELTSYSINVGPGQVVQEVEPFRRKANRPNLGWGYAKVGVVSGTGIMTSASVIDALTADATTIPMKR